MVSIEVGCELVVGEGLAQLNFELILPAAG
jgi:hypothetical protein